MIDTSETQRRQLLTAADALARPYDDEQAHARQVTRLALRLFDELAGLHELGPDHRILLECAARLHDIGWTEGRKGHHKTSARLILEDNCLPLDDRQRKIVAATARYHRKALPKAKHEHIQMLDEPDRRTVLGLGAMLRLADGLDRSHQGLVEELACTWDERTIHVACRCRREAGQELWAARRKSEMMVMAFRRRVVVDRM